MILGIEAQSVPNPVSVYCWTAELGNVDPSDEKTTETRACAWWESIWYCPLDTENGTRVELTALNPSMDQRGASMQSFQSISFFYLHKVPVIHRHQKTHETLDYRVWNEQRPIQSTMWPKPVSFRKNLSLNFVFKNVNKLSLSLSFVTKKKANGWSKGGKVTSFRFICWALCALLWAILVQSSHVNTWLSISQSMWLNPLGSTVYHRGKSTIFQPQYVYYPADFEDSQIPLSGYAMYSSLHVQFWEWAQLSHFSERSWSAPMCACWHHSSMQRARILIDLVPRCALAWDNNCSCNYYGLASSQTLVLSCPSGPRVQWSSCCGRIIVICLWNYGRRAKVL